MGRGAADDTVGAIILALMKQRRWEQSQLARHLEVNVVTLRRSLRRLQARDPSITSETDAVTFLYRDEV